MLGNGFTIVLRRAQNDNNKRAPPAVPTISIINLGYFHD
jgi:hypothetical protein